MDITLSQFLTMTPELIIALTAVIVLIVDLIMPRGKSRTVLGYVALAGIVAATIMVIYLIGQPAEVVNEGVFYTDPLSKAFKLIILIGSSLSMLLAINYRSEHDLEPHRAEFFIFFLTALLGAMVMMSSINVITLFIGMELLTISSCILIGMERSNARSSEAAMKYLINGGVAAAIMLFGLSYMYGLTGSMNLNEIALSVVKAESSSVLFLLLISFVIVIIGLTFKISTVPFSMWSLDVYEGAPTPVTAFLSTVSKTAGFYILFKIVYSALSIAAGSSDTAVTLDAVLATAAILAAITMLVGNLAALRQVNMKRLLACSSVAHAGYILVAFAVVNENFSVTSAWFYLLAYTFAMIGIFAIVQFLEKQSNNGEVSMVKGLYQRSPFLAINLGVLVLSLLGIPLTAGFIGKMSIFMAAFNNPDGAYALPFIMIVATAISFAYYSKILIQAFMRNPVEDKGKLKVPSMTKFVLVICTGATLLLGILPSIGFEIFFNIVG